MAQPLGRGSGDQYSVRIDGLHFRQHISRRALAALSLLVLVVLWLIWPAFGSQPGVILYGDPDLQDSNKQVSEELRDRGLVPDWSPVLADSWCSAAAQPFPPVAPGASRLVLAFTQRGICDGDPVGVVVAAARTRHLTPVVVLEPDAFDPARTDIATVYTATLLGPAGTTQMRCEWWDGCPADQPFIAVRDADGALTDAGRGRLARMLTMAVGS